MPQLPTARATEERRLGEIWGGTCSAEEPADFFDELGAIIKVRLTLRSRIRVAEVIAG